MTDHISFTVYGTTRRELQHAANNTLLSLLAETNVAQLPPYRLYITPSAKNGDIVMYWEAEVSAEK